MLALSTVTAEENQAYVDFTCAGLSLIHQGDVCDTYALPNPNLLLIYATDRLSVFDFVLSYCVPKRGEILTALTVYWLKEALKDTPHYLVAYGSGIDTHLPIALRNKPEYQKRGVVVRRIDMLPVECIVQGYSANGYRLTQPICTMIPENQAADAIKENPLLSEISVQLYQQAADISKKWGLILADTKFKFGLGYVLGGLVGAPESSTYWLERDLATARNQGASPKDSHKGVVHSCAKSVATPFGVTGINSLDPLNEDHVQFVRSLEVPVDAIANYLSRYRFIQLHLTRLALEYYQDHQMNISK